VWIHLLAHTVVAVREARESLGAFGRRADTLDSPTSVTRSFPFPRCTVVELLLLRAVSAPEDAPAIGDDVLLLASSL
jgi:hypothetical protein